MTLMTILGLMSGTSMDGIDAACVRTDGEDTIQILSRQSLRYPEVFQHLLKITEFAAQKTQGSEHAMAQRFPQFIQAYAEQHFKDPASFYQQLCAYCDQASYETIQYTDIVRRSTEFHATLASNFTNLDAIAYHGQTLYHSAQQKMSLQMGDPEDLVQRTKRPVISQFRQADLLAGGQGAPLAPIYHLGRARQNNTIPLVVINCGGLANVTILPDASPDSMVGFDCGPGNVLLDRYVRRERQAHMDKDGRYALQGKCQPALLASLLENACAIPHYFTKPYPKSLNSYDFTLIPEIASYDFYDVCCTLAHFTAYTVAQSILSIDIERPSRWILTGGGWQHPVIRQALASYIPPSANIELCVPEAINWQSQYIEAELMAYLAARHHRHLPSTFPSTTGVSNPTICGVRYAVSS